MFEIRIKMGPLEDNTWNNIIISEGFLKSEELNKQFSSVFTSEDISSLPTQFNGNKTKMLGQLIVTAEGAASKISNLKENSHPG